jgi:hypothetical protein
VDDQSTHPYGPDAPKEDYLGLALGALVVGVSLGIGLNAIVGLVVRTLQANRPPATGIDLGEGPAVVLLAGTVVACLGAAIATWRLMAPVRSTYRQGMFAMVAFFASFMGSVTSMLADRALGRAGLVALAALALAFGLWLARRLTRGSA